MKTINNLGTLKLIQTKFFKKLFILVCITMPSCMNSNLPKYIELTGLRVLTMIADKPEANPGDTVTITPVISDVTETSAITYEARACIDPGVALGATAVCPNTSTNIVAQGTITSASNSEMAQNFTGSAPTFSITIPASEIIFLQRSEIEKYNGVGYLITYQVTNSKNETVKSYKRIVVSNKTISELNSNPIINNILSNGAPLSNTAYPLGGKFLIQLDYPATANQTYSIKKEDASLELKTEELTTTWFITDGVLKYYRNTNQDTNEFTAPDSTSTTRKNFLMSVTRDNRGGTTVKRICGGC